MRNLDPAWAPAMRSGAKPVWYVTLSLGPIAYLTITNYSGAGTSTVTVHGTAGSVTYTAGTDFQAVTSNAQTAFNLAAAVGTGVGFRAYAVGATVFVYSTLPAVTTLTITTSLATWVTIPTPLSATYEFLSNPCANMAPQISLSLSTVSPVRNVMDPLTRTVSIGSVDVLFMDDGWLRSLLAQSRPRGRLMTVELGCDSLQTSQFAPVGTYLIDEIIPSPGQITLRGIEPMQAFATTTVQADFMCMHPASAIQSLIHQISFPAALYDATTLDNTTSMFTSAGISHWACTRSNQYTNQTTVGLITGASWPNFNNGMNAPMNAKSVLDDLCRLMYATFAPDETGLHSLRLYNAAASPVRSFSPDDISELVVTHTIDNTISEVLLTGISSAIAGSASAGPSGRVTLVDALDYASLYGTGIPGAPQQNQYVLSTDWLGVPGFLIAAVGTGTGRTLICRPCVMAGMSGSVQDHDARSGSGMTQRPTDQLNAGASPPRYAYLLLVGMSGGSYLQEVVQVSSFAYSTIATPVYGPGGTSTYTGTLIDDVPYGVTNKQNATYTSVMFDPDFNPAPGSSTRSIYSYGAFNVSARNYINDASVPAAGYTWGAGSPGEDITKNPRVYDITIAMATANTILNRFRWGAPVIRIRVPAIHWDLQIGDFVTISNDTFLSFQKTAADASVVFEITGKELVVLDDSPGLWLELTWARDDVTPAASTSFYPIAGAGTAGNTSQAITDSGGNVVTDSASEIVTT